MLFRSGLSVGVDEAAVDPLPARLGEQAIGLAQIFAVPARTVGDGRQVRFTENA